MIPTQKKIQALQRRLNSGASIPRAELQWLAAIIDHTLLKPESGEAEIRQLCREAREFGFATVCVYPKFIPLCRELLAGSNVKAIAVIGFPTGLEATTEKMKQTEAAVANGAQEIDMVLNIEKLQARRLRAVYLDIRKVVTAAKCPVKVILETYLLSDEEKDLACALAAAAGASFVKTSTGFSTGGATAHDVARLRRAVGKKLGVKASGGIRTLSACLEMVLAGADRIGASAGVAIVGGANASPSTGY